MLLDKGNIPINFLSNNQRFIRLNEQDIEPLKIQYKKRCHLIDNKTIDNITKIKNKFPVWNCEDKNPFGTVSDIAEKMTNEGFISGLRRKRIQVF